MAREGASVEKAQTAPHEDDDRKPGSPSDLVKPAWTYTAKKAWMEFGRDQCTDLAAALTYYAVLAIFPAMLALVSLLGVFGQGQSTTEALLDIVRQLGQGSAADALQGPIEQMTRTQAAGFAFVFGIVGAIWSASGYVGAFGRAMNRIYQIDEGRPVWKLRPLQLLLTLAGILLVALLLIGLVVSGPLARSIGDVIGLGDTAVTVWGIAKWPVMLAIVIVLVAVLYYATPNVRQPKFRWMSVGAAIAILVWLLASVAFGFYVANFGSYNKTYGSLAGVIVFLLWLWITNLALLFGAEVDAELERSRELQAGIEAEETIQLPPRDTRASDKKAEKLQEKVEEGRRLREEAQRNGAHNGAHNGAQER
ncbi:YihY/virulence factor BrkB family protein [Knoellia sp. p5-6-4]|uniref:YihY/virulence factor BrkB family protein n=1 Tax=unclassified Knoellia TaxID=2618719 RepID=UPI0023DC737F|nr:YihY/virulence factor BrkB family protein [Knoellia sp. p5-6-4]MDF2144415.1 YihY/virulence factor BrkB family protein [Knoellia sp. p5-6-4]